MSTVLRTVILPDPSGRVHRFVPGDRLPAWAASKVTNRAVTSASAAAVPPATRQPSDAPSATEDEVAATAAGEPNRRGAGSGKDAWVAYAMSLGINVHQGMSRDEIISLVDQVRS